MKFLAASLSIALLFCNFAFAQESRPLEIIEKPEARYPTGGPCFQGVVRLRVEFLASGEIGKIQTVSKLTNTAIKNAIEAAKKIKFNPAVKNGEPVTVAKVLEYNFTIY